MKDSLYRKTNREYAATYSNNYKHVATKFLVRFQCLIEFFHIQKLRYNKARESCSNRSRQVQEICEVWYYQSNACNSYDDCSSGQIFLKFVGCLNVLKEFQSLNYLKCCQNLNRVRCHRVETEAHENEDYKGV